MSAISRRLLSSELRPRHDHPGQGADFRRRGAHYDDLDLFYRELWEHHVHHVLWTTGFENPAQAVENLIAREINRDQEYKSGIECDLCAPRLLSCVASDSPSSRLRTRITQSWSFSPGTHIPLQNKKLAHPTRFERVTFAFGGQTPTNPVVHRRRKLKGWASTWTSHDGFHERLDAKRQFSV